MDFQYIDKKREEKRFSVTEFCELVGIDRTTYYKYLKDPGTMKISTWVKMANILKLTEAERRASLR